MSIIVKTFDQIVSSIMNRLYASGLVDNSNSSTMRTIIEAIVAELDIQYYQIQYIYDAMGIDTATGDDLDKLVSILNVYRDPAKQCTGIVRFARSTPVLYDIPIASGTVVSMRPNIYGKVYEFVTVNDAVLSSGSTWVDVDVMAVDAGNISIPQHTLTIMNNPVFSIDTVDNQYSISGGSDKESDASLRYRAKLALQKLGKATNSALEGAILDIDGVEQVSVLDMHRGKGTSDIIVMCSINPVPQNIINEISSIVASTKASGIDVQVIYPSIVYVNISVSLSILPNVDMDTIRSGVGNSILSYMRSLGNADTMIIKQMERSILSSINTVVDMQTVTPSSNVTCTDTQILRAGTITIDGEVWVNG